MIHAGFPTRPRGVLLAQEKGKPLPSGMVDRLIIRAEKTYSGLQRNKTLYPMDYIHSKMRKSTIAKVPSPRFKEWTYDLLGLEFTLSITLPPLPANIAFGLFNYEREPIQMVRCIPADLLQDKYNVTATPGVVYQPTTNWWLLITAQRVSDLVDPLILSTCPESLRTMASPDRITCFHIIDLYRGKIKFEWWLELIILVLSNFTRIRFLDEWTLFWGSSQARTREIKKKFELRRLKELKDKVERPKIVLRSFSNATLQMHSVLNNFTSELKLSKSTNELLG